MTFPREDITTRETALAQHGDQFLKAKGAKKKGKGLPPEPKDFKRDWHGMSPTQMLEEVKMPGAYVAAWGSWSQWQHWNSGMGIALARVGDIVSLEPASYSDGVVALMTGIGLHRLVAAIVADYLSLSEMEQIKELMREMDSWLKSREVT